MRRIVWGGARAIVSDRRVSRRRACSLRPAEIRGDRALLALGIAVIGLLALGARSGLEAQLISPGKLTSAHGQLEGMRNCTQCHELRKPGVQDERCLACHEPLAQRVEADRGYHARVEGECASCHKEHFGIGFDMVRFDSTTFEHREAGFELAGAHTRLTCRDCHTPELITAVDVRVFKLEHGALNHTFLGLGTTCLSCHRRDDPHEGQFGQSTCTDCHTEEEWTPASGFDHDGARYRLTGEHRQVECESCHASSGAGESRSTQYRPVAFSRCTSCHEDYHDTQMGSVCTDCHNTGGWQRIDRGQFEGGFDHEATGYSLVGAHGEVECAGCHDEDLSTRPEIQLTYEEESRGRSYPRPAAADCLSCHVDYHEAVFVDSQVGLNCEGCHGQDGWLPSTYDLFRHNRESSFELTGAHVATECSSCHAHVEAPRELIEFQIADVTCAACHVEEDPHQDQFADQACEDCHRTESFLVEDFDHDRTEYPLDGAHQEVECAACHLAETDAGGGEFARYAPLDTSCRACHEGA